jgi:hypothetical protein
MKITGSDILEWFAVDSSKPGYVVITGIETVRSMQVQSGEEEIL